MQPYRFNDFKKHSVIFVFKSNLQKCSGVDCDIIIKTVNALLTVGKYCRLTNEITDYKIVAIEFLFQRVQYCWNHERQPPNYST
jgi:hypothetical protein